MKQPIERYRFCHNFKTRETTIKPDNRTAHSGSSIIGGCLVLFHIGSEKEALREGTKQVMHYNQYGELKQ
jgi:hypothetical protein